MYEFPAWVLLCKSKCMSVCVSPKFKFYLLTALAWIEPLSCRTISIVMVTVLQVQEWLFCGLSMNFFMVQDTWYMKVITHLWNLKESWKSIVFFLKVRLKKVKHWNLWGLPFLFTEEICVERGSDRLRVESCTYVTASLADPLHACHELTFKIFLIDFEIWF